ncbi:hypothetical protein PT015_04045 [Candidatus Mycobacterium wuenschmannii]|uniref:Secreted protein n=1 Tax=Candidatus Mycobacterium wuenschmannii TaxID=3027808 RepID=A0ABY8W001_9MYCO|nr:hypothetical protein [Candidatus Mycobacterium wuenschmannii]WIM88676.1 hypothetical protein PT015_04045 [Candidatus Mycobacterium wuenschmannii]
MTKKLMMVAACVAALGMGSGVAHADDNDPAPAQADSPPSGGPLCNVMGGDDGTKWEYAPCGWAYGDEKGWYRVP